MPAVTIDQTKDPVTGTVLATQDERVVLASMAVALANFLALPTATANASTGATQTILAAQTGQTFLLDRAALAYTLPAATPGLKFKFVTTLDATAAEIEVATPASEFLQGSINAGYATAGAGAIYQGNGTSHVAVKMNGTTTGGKIGTQFDLECLVANKWQISGNSFGSGTLATPFATSV